MTVLHLLQIIDNLLCPKFIFFTTENSEVERKTNASDLANPLVKVVTIAPKINNAYFFSLVFSSHSANNIPMLIYPAPIKILPRGPRITHKILVGIPRNRGSESLAATNSVNKNPKIINVLQAITI